MNNYYNPTQGSMPTVSEMYKGAIGNPIYDYAMKDWRAGLNNYSGMMQSNLGAMAQSAQRYAKGGSYGVGQRQTSQESVQAGVASDQLDLAKSGMSGQAASSALNTRASGELAKLYGNIEDSRNQLLAEQERARATQYTQMMQGYSQMQQARPQWGKA